MAEFSSFEQFDRETETKPPEPRLFGLALALAFALVGCARVWRGGHPRLWAIGICAVFLSAAILRPALLAPLAAAWTAMLRPVSRALTLVAMGLLFFLVVTPLSWIRRLWVPDPLGKQLDRHATSYWRCREPNPPENMRNQF